MDRMIMARRIYTINHHLIDKYPIFIYGVDAGSQFIYQELKRLDIQVKGFYIFGGYCRYDFCDLPVYDLDSMNSLEKIHVVLPLYKGELIDKFKKKKYPISFSLQYSISK